MGRRLGARARGARVQGARDHELRASRSRSAGSTAARRSTRSSRTPPRSTPPTDLPVAVDLENGYGASPEAAANAVARVAEAGAVGGSIEDWDPGAAASTSRPHAAERIAAAAEAAHALGFPFVLTGRAENHIRGNPDLDDTIARLQAYERAGADVLYAPGPAHVEEIRAVCDAVTKPVNVLALPASPSPRSSARVRSGSASAAR